VSSILTSILALLVTLGLLIAFHEFGHFWTARRLGVKVLRYCIGFGKPLWSKRYGKDQTEFALAAFPLGGYVKMLDEREGEVDPAERHRAFNTQPVASRFAIVAAGPIFNFIFAISAFWIMYLIGVPGMKPIIGEVTPDSVAAQAGFHVGDEIIAVAGDETPTWSVARITLLDKALDQDHVLLTVKDENGIQRMIQLSVQNLSAEVKQGNLLEYLGIAPYRPVVPAVIGELEAGGAAQQSGLKSGDRILKANGEPIKDWLAFVEFVRSHPNESVQLTTERDAQQRVVTVNIGERKTDTGVIGRIGAAPASIGPMPEHLKASVSPPPRPGSSRR
jgi:regulator of sigma E protease